MLWLQLEAIVTLKQPKHGHFVLDGFYTGHIKGRSGVFPLESRLFSGSHELTIFTTMPQDKAKLNKLHDNCALLTRATQFLLLLIPTFGCNVLTN